MSEALKTASVLAFERKLDVADGLFYAGVWAERLKSSSWPGVEVREKSVRGTISNRLKKAGEQDPAKLDAAIEKPNLQTVDVASLPVDCDTLKLSFTVRALGGVGQPSACNNTEYRAKLSRTVAAYFQANGARELARRYAGNLANGRFLWRNRLGAEQVEVRVDFFQNGATAQFWTFDALAFSLNSFEAPPDYRAALAELAQCLEEGLTGPKPALLQVTAYARLGAGQEVFPSQELILERGTKNKSKTLYKVGNIAGMHSQKLGNALRTIDTWYPGSAEQGPIAAEPYGAVTSLGKAYRQPKDKVDFYSLLDSWILKDKAPTLENQHFVMAVLIRGGVFGKAEE